MLKFMEKKRRSVLKTTKTVIKKNTFRLKKTNCEEGE